MAKKNLEILISAKDKTSRQLRTLNKSFDRLKRGVGASMKGIGIAMAATTAAVAGLGYGAKKLIDVYGIQERAEARLTSVIKNVVKGRDKDIEALKKQASALQKVTLFGDEQIISAQALFATFGVNTKQILKMTPALLDTASALEKASGGTVDLEAVTTAVGKSLTDGIGALKRYGVTIDDATMKLFREADQTEKVNIVLNSLNSNYKGVAAASANTYTGNIKQMENAFGDLHEIVGGVLAERINPFVKKLTVWAGETETQDKLKIISDVAIDTGKEFINLLGNIFGIKKGEDPLLAISNALFMIKGAFRDINHYVTVLKIGLNKLIWAFKEMGRWSKISPMSWAMGKIGFQHGTPYVPATGMYQLHKGEAVIPAHRNKVGAGGIVVNLNGGNYLGNARDVGRAVADYIIDELGMKVKVIRH